MSASKCSLGSHCQSCHTGRVALPFCHVSLKAARPSKIPQNPHTWGDHIKKRRLELRLFQKDVAQTLGVDETTVNNWEKNHSKPILHLFPKVIKFLGYDPMPINQKTLGEEMVQYRKSLGMTQMALAKLIGIDPTTLSRIERSKAKCFPTTARKLHKYFDNCFQTTKEMDPEQILEKPQTLRDR